jgi:drug/metabolite transporter (DMT)-like permease
MLLAVVFALAAALANAVNLMTQHKASISAPKRVKGWHLALYLPRQPLWLLGVAAAVGSFVFQALALHNGPMSVVQPLLITELVFTLVLRRVWIHQDVARAAWASTGVVCMALAVFLAGLDPRTASGRPHRPTARPRPDGPSTRKRLRPAPRLSGAPRSRRDLPATGTTAGRW